MSLVFGVIGCIIVVAIVAVALFKFSNRTGASSEFRTEGQQLAPPTQLQLATLNAAETEKDTGSPTPTI